MSKDCIQSIMSRRSIRRYTDGTISENDIEMILRAGFSAPSAGNMQPWRVVVVRKESSRNRLAEAALRQTFVARAPVVLVVCAVPRESALRYGERGMSLYVLQDTAALVENLLLAAHFLGYGACWVGAFNEDLARGAVGVPDDMRPVAIIPIGISAEPTSRTRPRRPLSEVVVSESF
ncbi:MAG: nitroreductase family protein [Candidatus Thorarchaeota archaeon]